MIDPSVPEALRGFIHECIPHVDAVELLLLLAVDPARGYRLHELVEKLRPAEVSEATLERYLARFGECGLVAHDAGAYRLGPAAPQYQVILDALGTLYNERPVTLVRMIYAPKEERIRAFADAFKLKKT